ncbi:Stk1 family PASTA domain-containing Ser/Thr kinase [Bailinhaonella thermotolerans]|uniref:non-specific serine/threonine protein kinase n=1 Tax=Bailinhaonella thermotolerans TaxID=1070861 RepID=A0A3A4AQM1_9ACTN|nr:Stk1 family PASTA domain-containing Ser/Thr kinase [Bailinhaonella thermotolerans]RJL31381.1 Stk1 family PASTA domain-containing Ser/Thr kinase [Bailinhaonella thermotolerans]
MDTTLADPLVGQTLDGRYRVESRIARGGMATVYLGTDTRLERTVALKVMHSTLAQDPDFVRRFIGEAKSVAKLSHPNVVSVYDQGAHDGVAYLAMEYVAGRTLRDLLRERGRLGPREALEITIPVLAALGAAHQAGLIHRDVKPENVLLTDDGRVKVVDFGLARAVESTNQTRTGVLIGTIAYLSPEQVTTGHADARSDVYAAGIMLFELLTGHQPYNGETPMSVAYRHVHDTVSPPSSLVPGVPPALDGLVCAATDRDPDRRPADASAMLVAAVSLHKSMPEDDPSLLSVAAATPRAQPTVPPSPAGQTTVLNRGDTTVFSGPPAAPPAPRGFLGGPKRWLLVTLALVLVAGVGFSGWWFTSGRYVYVPDLVGQDVDAAAAEARGQGFTVVIGNAVHDLKVKSGRVLRMDPQPQARVLHDAKITLIPSAGPRKIEVPKLEGLTQDQAREALAKAGLKLDDVRNQGSNTVPRGQVISSRPAAGTRLNEGGKVDITVSQGPLMPDLMGMMRDQVEQWLRERGFQNIVIVEQQDDAPPGQVIAQDPPAWRPVAFTDPVQLTVSKGNGGFPWPWLRGDKDKDKDLVDVPDTRFKNVSDARSDLQAAGFKVKVKSLVGGNLVKMQSPLGKAPRGSQITLWS